MWRMISLLRVPVFSIHGVRPVQTGDSFLRISAFIPKIRAQCRTAQPSGFIENTACRRFAWF